MFSNKFNIPKQHYRVDTHPMIPELTQYIEQANKIKGVKHCFTWDDSKAKKQYSITLHMKAKDDEEIEWWMHESSETGQRMVWFYRTNDIGTVLTQVLQAVGAPEYGKEHEAQSNLDGNLGSALGGISHSTPNTKFSPGSTIAASQAAAKPPLAKLLSCNLQSVPMTSVLQTAGKEDATGRLLIESSDGEAVVLFVHGRPVHAVTPMQSGQEALLELCTWMQGRTTFTPGTSTDTITISQSAEQILYLAAELLENIAFLQDNAVDDVSYLKRASDSISEQEFEKKILDGPPLGLDLQKRFFQHLDGTRMLKDIAALLSLSASQWIAIIANLLRLGLVLTPDGRCIEHNPYANTESVQAVSDAFFPASNQNSPSAAERMGVSGTHQLPPVVAPAPPQIETPVLQSQSGQFTTHAAPAGSWGSQVSETKQSAPLLPPTNMFGGGGGASAINSFRDATSPSVAAFGSATPDADFAHVGLWTNEVAYNPTQAKSIADGLCDRESEIFSFNAMQFFLEREFTRAFRFGAGFSLIVFGIKMRHSDNAAIPIQTAVLHAVHAVSKLKNDVDTFGYFGEKGYAIIVPNANAAQAAALVDKIANNVPRMIPEAAPFSPMFYAGIASVPTDAKDVESLVHNAQTAMQNAIKRNATRVLFADLTS